MASNRKHLPVPPLDDTSATALARLDGPQEGQRRPHPGSSSSSSSSSTSTLFWNSNMSPKRFQSKTLPFLAFLGAKPISKQLTPTLPIFIQPSLTDCDGFFLTGNNKRPTRLPKVDGRKELRPRAPSREWMDIETINLFYL